MIFMIYNNNFTQLHLTVRLKSCSTTKLLFFLTSCIVAKTMPQITPRQLRLRLGENGTFVCHCKGKVKWFHTSSLHLLDGKKAIDGNSILNLTNVNSTMGGFYSCYCERNPHEASYIAESKLYIMSKKLPYKMY